jgi:hypothetical protein
MPQFLHPGNPEPMLHWFWSRHLELSGNLLTCAARHNRVAGARWISHHTDSRDDWRQAVSAATDKPERESAKIFKIIIRHMPPDYRRDSTDSTLSQDLSITVVGRAWAKSRLYDCSSRGAIVGLTKSGKARYLRLGK